MLTPEMLGGFKVLVMPNALCLSDAQCQAIRDYVARGGSVVGAHETSLADEHGDRRGRISASAMCSVPG